MQQKEGRGSPCPSKSPYSSIESFEEPAQPGRRLELGNRILDILRNRIRDESVHLCYIDPPFNSKRNYNQIYNRIGNEDLARYDLKTRRLFGRRLRIA